MHAIVFEVDIHNRDASLQELKDRVVPRVAQAPGLVAAYWIAFSESEGTSVAVFDDEEHAQAMADMAQANPPSHVTFRRVRTAPVVAHT
jgi:uncharacterized protein YmfQ (DUF2313 family)